MLLIRLSPVIDSLQCYQQSVDFISNLQKSHADHFKNILSHPLDRTLRQELKNQAEVRREWDNAKQDYEHKLKRLKKVSKVSFVAFK